MPEERLQKILSQAGVASRRHAEIRGFRRLRADRAGSEEKSDRGEAHKARLAR